MGALSSFATDHKIAFGLYFDHPWILKAFSLTAYILWPAGLKS